LNYKDIDKIGNMHTTKENNRLKKQKTYINIYSIELHIARKREKLTFNLKKWKKLIRVVAN